MPPNGRMNSTVQVLLGIAMFLVIGTLIFSFAWRRPEKVYVYQMPAPDYYYDVPVMRRPLFDGVVPVRRLDYNPWLNWDGGYGGSWGGYTGVGGGWHGGGKGNVGWHSGGRHHH
jgi:hypothetical protein